MKRMLFVLVSILIAGSIVMAGCTTTTPTPAPVVATTAPSNTVVPTTAAPVTIMV